MGLLQKIEIRNFKCFRDWVVIDLNQSTYLAGANNSGKTGILAGLASFFDTAYFRADFINKTELSARRPGFNRSEIKVTFDLSLITGKGRRDRMIERYGDSLVVSKQFVWREASDTVSITYGAPSGNEPCNLEDLDSDVKHLLASVSVSYIHPQEGIELLRRAQDKFKRRLFHNWGRHASVAERVDDAQKKWAQLRQTANSYLSAALTTKLKEIWPGAEVKVDLPERIQDIVAVSDITFRSSPNLPQITLPSHGTGAQSAILYQTHYLLDSDRTLHQGMYFPVWLLEEPESFLHADIALQLARLLSSPEWLDSIQMVISTHSPIVLAASRQEEDRCSWAILEGHEVRWQKGVAAVTDDDILEVGCLMGDANFDVYFNASSRTPRIFLEDSRKRTRSKFEDCGVSVTECLGGVDVIKKYLDVLTALGEPLAGETYFIVDADDGLHNLKRFLNKGKDVGAHEGWRKIEIVPRVFLILLPEPFAVEDLFAEWSRVLDAALDDIYDDSFALRSAVPTELSRVVSDLRRRNPESREDARAILRTHQDVKDRFWTQANDWRFEAKHITAVQSLMPTLPAPKPAKLVDRKAASVKEKQEAEKGTEDKPELNGEPMDRAQPDSADS